MHVTVVVTCARIQDTDTLINIAYEKGSHRLVFYKPRVKNGDSWFPPDNLQIS